MDDVIPLSIEEIYNKVRSELPQDSGQGQQATTQQQQQAPSAQPTQQRPVPTRVELDALYQDALASNPNLTREEFNARVTAQLGQ